MRTFVLVAVALLSACATVGRDDYREQRSIRYTDLPADLREVMGVRGDAVVMVYAVPWEWTWMPLGDDGQTQLVDGLPVIESCRIVSWLISPDGDWRSGGQFVVDGREGDWYIKGVVVPALPFGNWRTIWMGNAPMPAEYRPR